MMNAHETDKLLERLFKENAPKVDEEALRDRVVARSRQKQRMRRRASTARTLVVVCASLVVIAAASYGAYSAVTHFRGHRVLVLTDSTVQTTPGALAESTTTNVDLRNDPTAQAQAKVMTSAAVTLTAGGKTYTLTPGEITSALDYTPLYGAQFPSVPHLSGAKLGAFFSTVAPAVETAAADASFATDGTKVWVVPGKDGTAIDADWTAVALSEAALKTSGRTAEVVTKAKEPGRTTEQAEGMGVRQLLASYTTQYTGDALRQSNVKVATKYASGVLVAPGAEYDLEKQLGPRTAARGWKLAPGIVGPDTVEDVLGGGITQVATTLFNAVGDAGLQIVERHNHSLFIPHYPKGRDAVLTGGGKDFRFKNDTDHYVWVVGASDGVTTTFRIWGTGDGRTVQWSVGSFYDVRAMATSTTVVAGLKTGQTTVIQGGQAGKSVDATRVVTRDGTVIHNDVFVSVWPMYPEVIGVGK
jgi:vancomycin resistance protein YoaR